MNMVTNQAVLNELIGLTITEVHGLEKQSEQVILSAGDKHFEFYHEQDCCESVDLEDFEGDAEDLVGGLVIRAEEYDSDSDYIKTRNLILNNPVLEPEYGSATYTFYRISTTKGDLWMRWMGESNGYYSEEITVALRQNGKTILEGCTWANEDTD